MTIPNSFGLFQNILKLHRLLEKECLLQHGASTFHKGIDVGAPEGTMLYAVCDGDITFADFLGGGGYTITLSTDTMKITYCHVSPNFIVREGDKVVKGQYISNVGPKNVYGVVRKYL